MRLNQLNIMWRVFMFLFCLNCTSHSRLSLLAPDISVAITPNHGRAFKKPGKEKHAKKYKDACCIPLTGHTLQPAGFIHDHNINVD